MRILLIIFLTMLFLISNIQASTIKIPADQSTIQDGIDAARNGDVVLVQPGIYVENINFNGKKIIVGSLFLTTDDTSYVSQTIIDGDKNGSVVTFENEEDSTAQLIGFTVINGKGLSYYRGGGITCYNYSSPSLRYVTIKGNTSPEGGGIYCHKSSPIMINLTISENKADRVGGGIYCYFNSNPRLENVIISGNTAGNGGGICTQHMSNPVLMNTTVKSNSATGDGGGIFCSGHSNLSLMNIIVSDNKTNYSGGGIILINSSATLMNVIFSGNTSDWPGGAITCAHSSPSLVNVTISGNESSGGGAICCAYSSSPTLLNSILWNNSPQEIYFVTWPNHNSITISYSDVQGGQAGIVTNNNGNVNWLEGNIDADPLFIDIVSYYPSENSPCIDAGSPDPIYCDPEDPVNPGFALWPARGRILNDIGAYGGPKSTSWYTYVSVEGNKDEANLLPMQFELFQNYPNPFNSITAISFKLMKGSFVNLSIYNVLGELVEILVNKRARQGYHSIHWNADQLKSGIYIYKIKAGEFSATGKCLLLK